MAKPRVRVKIKDDKLKNHLRRLPDHLMKAVKKEMGHQSRSLTSYIIQEHMTGSTSATNVATRSGQLRRTTRPLPVRDNQGRITGGVRFGSHYASIHVGKPGEVTTIRPKNAKALAIPIGKAKTPAGVSKYKSPKDVPGLSYIKRKGKAPLLARVNGKTMEPMFVLVPSVKIPARIFPREILRARSRFIEAGFLRVLKDANKSL